MQYKSSSDPLYPVVIKHWRTDEKVKFLDWAKENIKSQFLTISQNSNGSLEQYTKPIQKNGYFGEMNDFAHSKDTFSGMILFTAPEDLTAFLIVFESTVEDQYSRY